MARKLQSDKWLFLATLALVCASVVMVYSASALVALERFQQPYLFVTRQMMWAAVGVAVLSIVMRVDYRAYRNARIDLAAARRGRRVMLVAVLFSPSDQRHPAVVWHRRLRHSAVRARQARRDPVHGADARAAQHRINELRYSLLPIALIVGGLVGLILLEPDFGTAVSLLADRRGDGVRRGPQLSLPARRRCCSRCRRST